jgi:hypothetical protein
MGLMQALMRLKRAEKVYTDMSNTNKKCANTNGLCNDLFSKGFYGLVFVKKITQH